MPPRSFLGRNERKTHSIARHDRWTQASRSVADPDHSIHQHPYLTTGISAEGRLLIVAHADASDDDRIRIINARRVTSAQRRTYEEG